MANPILKGGKPNQNNNPINQMLQFINGGGNPQNFINSLAGNQQGVQQLKNMVGNKNPKEFTLQMAKQRGIDPNQVMQLAQKLGLK